LGDRYQKDSSSRSVWANSSRDPVSKIPNTDGYRWLTSVILATQEAEIRRIVVQSQLKQNSSWDLILKKPSQKRAGGVAQMVE
jgi:hypothetical protein